jgi:hypothetical protein
MSHHAWLRLAILVVVGGCAGSAKRVTSASSGQVRTYYVAADEVTWDYAAGGTSGLTGEPLKTIGYFKNGPKRVSSSYVKALYRE